MSFQFERKLFLALLAAAALGCLFPIWAFAYLPMQDLPQHLFITKAVQDIANPAFNFSEYYTLNQTAGSYALFYWLTGLFAQLTNIEFAGKLFVSLYIVLFSLFILAESRDEKATPVPWALLLLFPFLFNPIYYMGFQNYLLSLPLLLFAIRDAERFVSTPVTFITVGRQLLWQLALFLSHPYTCLVFIALASVLFLSRFKKSDSSRYGYLPAAVMVLLFAGWLMASGGDVVNSGQQLKLSWWPFPAVLLYLMMMFTGLRITDGIAFAPLLGWIAIAVVISTSYRRQKGKIPFNRFHLHCLLLCLCGFFVMPFWLGEYAYFNLRMGPISYAFLALSLAPMAIPRKLIAPLVVSVGLLIGLSARLHAKLSAEIDRISPLLEMMTPNATVYAKYISAASAHLDPRFFYQLHANDHYYYHLKVGGGFSPTLFPSKLIPIQYRSDLPRQLFEENQELGQIAQHFRYILVRQEEDESRLLVSDAVRIIGQNGAWTLLERSRK